MRERERDGERSGLLGVLEGSGANCEDKNIEMGFWKEKNGEQDGENKRDRCEGRRPRIWVRAVQMEDIIAPEDLFVTLGTHTQRGNREQWKLPRGSPGQKK